MEDFAGLDCESEKPNVVVVGLAPSMFDYEHLNTAFRYVAYTISYLNNT